MTYVVTESCIKCKYMDCVEVCPVDCFYVGENMLVIHPDECHRLRRVRTGVSRPRRSYRIPTTSAADWLERNRAFATAWPNITRKGTPPDDADDWKDKPGKASLLSPKPGTP